MITQSERQLDAQAHEEPRLRGSSLLQFPLDHTYVVYGDCGFDVLQSERELEAIFNRASGGRFGGQRLVRCARLLSSS